MKRSALESPRRSRRSHRSVPRLNVMEEEARKAEEQAREALSALQEWESAPADESSSAALSSTSRKRVQKRSAQRLASAKEQLESVADGQLLRAAEAARLESEQGAARVSSLQQQLSDLSDQHDRLRQSQRDAQNNADALREQLASEARAKSDLEAQVKDLTAQLEHFQEADKRAAEAEKRCNAAEEARSQAAAQEQALKVHGSELQDDVSRWKGAAERHRTAVARLAADNVEMMMRLRGAESELEQAREEVKQLEEEARQQRSQWIEDAKCTVQEAVNSGLKRKEEADSEVQSEKQRRETAEAELSSERQRSQSLEQSLNTSKEQCSSLEEQLERAQSAQGEAERQASELRSEMRTLEQRLRNEKAQRSATESARAEIQRLLDEEKSKRIEAERQAHETDGGRRYAERLLHQQKSVNAQLMQQKESVEWQLMDLKALQASGKHKLHRSDEDGEKALPDHHVDTEIEAEPEGYDHDAVHHNDSHSSSTVHAPSEENRRGQSGEDDHGDDYDDVGISSSAPERAVSAHGGVSLSEDEDPVQEYIPDGFKEVTSACGAPSTRVTEQQQVLSADPLIAGTPKVVHTAPRKDTLCSFSNALPAAPIGPSRQASSQDG